MRRCGTTPQRSGLSHPSPSLPSRSGKDLTKSRNTQSAGSLETPGLLGRGLSVPLWGCCVVTLTVKDKTKAAQGLALPRFRTTRMAPSNRLLMSKNQRPCHAGESCRLYIQPISPRHTDTVVPAFILKEKTRYQSRKPKRFPTRTGGNPVLNSGPGSASTIH